MGTTGTVRYNVQCSTCHEWFNVPCDEPTLIREPYMCADCVPMIENTR